MTGGYRLLVIVIALSVFSKITLGDWEQTGGPDGCVVRSMLIIDSIVFIGTVDGVYASKFTEAGWTHSGLSNTTVFKLLENNGTVYARNYDTILSKTKDKGKTWMSIDPVSDRNFYAFLHYKDIVFSVFDGYGVYQSGDNGATWELVRGIAYNVTCLAVSKDTLFAGFSKGIFSRSEKSQDWTLVDTAFFKQKAVKSILVYDDVMFVIFGMDSYLCRSTDNGRTFKPIDAPVFQRQSSNNRVNDLFACNGNIIAATMDSGICISSDKGISWKTVNYGLPSIRSHTCLAAKGDTLFEGSLSGVYRSIDNGAHWTVFNHGLRSHEIRALTVSGDFIYAATYSGGVYRSGDNGDSWTQVNSGLQNVQVSMLVSTGNYILAGAQPGWLERGVYISSDSGTHWSASNSGLSPPEVKSISGITSLATTEKNFVYAGNSYGLHVSTDNGTTWKEIPAFYSSSITSIAVDGSTIYAATPFELFISRDNGENVVTADLNDKRISSVMASGDRVLVGSNEGNVYFSDDQGVTWKESRMGERRLVNVNVLTRCGKDTLFAGTDKNGIFVSIDNGSSWTEFKSGLTDSCILSLAVKKNYLFAGTETRSVWRRPLSEIIAAKGHYNYIPAAYTKFTIKLQKQINKSVSFSLNLPVKSYISADVYNAIGQKVAMLISENLQAGKHTRKWNAQKLPGGTYFCCFKTESFFTTIMVILP